MKLNAMPASVERSAARGVALRTRSAIGANASSMTPEQNVAKRPACQAMRTGSAAPAAIASILAGSMTRNTCAKSTRLETRHAGIQSAVVRLNQTMRQEKNAQRHDRSLSTDRGE